jgi:hypothetical protein
VIPSNIEGRSDKFDSSYGSAVASAVGISIDILGSLTVDLSRLFTGTGLFIPSTEVDKSGASFASDDLSLSVPISPSAVSVDSLHLTKSVPVVESPSLPDSFSEEESNYFKASSMFALSEESDDTTLIGVTKSVIASPVIEESKAVEVKESVKPGNSGQVKGETGTFRSAVFPISHQSIASGGFDRSATAVESILTRLSHDFVQSRTIYAKAAVTRTSAQRSMEIHLSITVVPVGAEKSNSSVGVIIGIVVGVLCLLLLVGAITLFLIFRSRRKKSQDGQDDGNELYACERMDIEEMSEAVNEVNDLFSEGIDEAFAIFEPP